MHLPVSIVLISIDSNTTTATRTLLLTELTQKEVKQRKKGNMNKLDHLCLLSDWLSPKPTALHPQCLYESLIICWVLPLREDLCRDRALMAANDYRVYLRNHIDMEEAPGRAAHTGSTHRALIFGTLAVMGLLQVASSVAILLHLTGYLREVRNSQGSKDMRNAQSPLFHKLFYLNRFTGFVACILKFYLRFCTFEAWFCLTSCELWMSSAAGRFRECETRAFELQKESALGDAPCAHSVLTFVPSGVLT